MNLSKVNNCTAKIRIDAELRKLLTQKNKQNKTNTKIPVASQMQIFVQAKLKLVYDIHGWPI